MSLYGNASRRQFLKVIAALLSGGAIEANYNHSGQASEASRFKISAWTGDDFLLGHRMRDGAAPAFPSSCEEKVDFVIVGGGMAGLTAAHYLRDHNFLLLEQYSKLGGESIGRSYRGIDYSLGAAYMGCVDGIYGELISQLQLTPVKMPSTRNSWYIEKKWLPGVSGPFQAGVYREFDRLITESKKVLDSLPQYGSYPASLSPDVAKLDSAVFASYLKGYSPRFLALLDAFGLSALCGGSNALSALAGFYLMEDLTGSAYLFKGGNPTLASALTSSLKGSIGSRIQTSCFVWNIEIKDGAAEVVYSSGDGSVHRVACRKVIVAAPPLVTARIIPQLDDTAKGLLLSHKYGSYLVANFLMRKAVFHGSFDNWTGEPFSFTDFIMAETPYLADGTYHSGMGSVLTVYQPYPARSPGRTILLAGQTEELAQSLASQLAKLVEQCEGDLDEVVLTRWGHAMTVAMPGFFTRLSKLATIDTDPVILAHNSTMGLPSAESAIAAARRAADHALGRKVN